MDNQTIIVAVSLYGSSAEEQPDPIVLRPEDESWRHFSTLMLSLYRSPPNAVNIKYLDDEKDWIDMGSEVEFSEALRMTRSTGGILQVQVCSITKDGWQNASFVTDKTSKLPTQDPFKWIPTTDLKYEWEERLVYPYPPASSSQGVMVTSVGGTQYTDAPTTQPWLVYPHSNTQHQPPTQPHEGVSCDPMVTQAPVSQHSTSQDKPSLSGSSRPVVAPRTSTQAAGDKPTLLAAATAWENAANLPPKDKVKFLRSLVSGTEAKFKTFSDTESKGQEAAASIQNSNVDSLIKEFDGQQKVDLPKEAIWEGQRTQLAQQGQDPFEVDTANVMDHAQLLSEMDNSPTLTPTKLSEPVKIDKSDSSQDKEVETPSAFKFAGLSSLSFDKALPKQQRFSRASSEPVAITVTNETSAVSSASKMGNADITLSNPKQSHKEGCKVKKAKEPPLIMDVHSTCKVLAKPPVPLPRAMLMMEGAPCGANAVAIEMPAEAEFSKLEAGVEEVAASGGAASVAASEETGEILAREGDAAAVSSQIKTTEERDCGAGAVVSWDTTPLLQVEVQPHKHRKEKSPEKKKKVKDGKSEKKSLKKKSDGDRKKDDKDKKKEEKKQKEEKTKKDEEKDKKKQSKEDNGLKLSEDVESGEKVRVKGDAALQYNDFVKYMRKIKKEMQASIVRDMSQETYRILQTGFFSLAQAELNLIHNDLYSVGVEHVGIYCDHCNDSIKGIRYKCGNCLDFDLCERCERLPDLHDPTHVFLKLRQPARNAGCGAEVKYCLLKEKIYQLEGADNNNPGTPVDLSIHSVVESQGSKSENPENKSISEAFEQVTNNKEEMSEREKHQYQEYRDLLARCSTEQSRDKQLVGHLGGCSETLNSSSFDLTMARGIDSGMSKIGQEAEERLVAHTGLVLSGPPRQRYRELNTPACSSTECCGDSNSRSSSIIQLPTPPESSITTLPSLDSGDASACRFEAQLVKSGNAIETSSLPKSTPMVAVTASSLPKSIPMVPLRDSTPKSAPMVPLNASTLPVTTSMVPLNTSTLPVMTPMVPLGTSTLPVTTSMVPLNTSTLPVMTPMVPLNTSTLPVTTSMVPLNASTPPLTTPMVPLVAATPSNILPMVPLVAAAPAPTVVAPNVDEVNKDEADEAQADDQEEAMCRVDSDFDEFVIENGLSSSEDDEDENDNDDEGYDENENRMSHLQLVWDSDSSDDFCIIDPQNVALIPEGFELLPDSRNLSAALSQSQAALTQSQTVTCDPDDTPNSCPAPSYEEVMSGSLIASAQGSVTNEITAPVSNHVETQPKEKATEASADPEETTPLIPVSVQRTSQPPVTTSADSKEECYVDAEGVPAHVAAVDSGLEGQVNTSTPVVEVAGGECCSDSPAVNQTEVTLNTGADSGLIHTMSESEKNRLLELLRMEMGRDLILEARRAEAEFRNRELELIGQQAEMKKEAGEIVHSSPTPSVAGSARSQPISRSTSVASSIGAAPVNEREGKFSRSSSVASSSTKDADCQTVSTGLGQDQPSASHIIQNVATGVSKAATTAFLTAKDVFHSLQAKQSDWKAPSSNYKPPQSHWKPPADTYRPPANTYKPKESTYKPPEDTYKPPRDYDDYSDYIPPSSSWTPPQSTFIPPNIEWIVGSTGGRNTGQISEASRGSHEVMSVARSEQQQAGGIPAVSDAGSTSVDEDLESDHLQREGMKRLVEMGFANREDNKRLLAQFNGDLSKVIQALVDGQANDNWAQARH